MANTDITLHSQNHELYRTQALIAGAMGICDSDENPHTFRALRVISAKINDINNSLDALAIGRAIDTSVRQQIDALYDVEALLASVRGMVDNGPDAKVLFLVDMAVEKIAEVAANLQTLDFPGSSARVALAA
jgi:DNA polymerase III epsilon subunit-like protein